MNLPCDKCDFLRIISSVILGSLVPLSAELGLGGFLKFEIASK